MLCFRRHYRVRKEMMTYFAPLLPNGSIPFLVFRLVQILGKLDGNDRQMTKNGGFYFLVKKG